MNNPYPHELQFMDIYITPWIPALILAFIFSALTAVIANKTGISRYLLWHRYLFLAIMILYLVLIDTTFIKVF